MAFEAGVEDRALLREHGSDLWLVYGWSMDLSMYGPAHVNTRAEAGEGEQGGYAGGHGWTVWAVGAVCRVLHIGVVPSFLLVVIGSGRLKDNHFVSFLFPSFHFWR